MTYIVTIDGAAGTGKSTVAKGVAKRLGIVCFDTGAMYRCFAWKVLFLGIDPKDEEAVSRIAEDFSVEIVTAKNGDKSYFVDKREITEKIRTRELSQVASDIAKFGAVRRHLVEVQRSFAKQQSAVFEGRDMGSVVFPFAKIKIFLTADSKVRAQRRYAELLQKFPDLQGSLTVEDILEEIEARDTQDKTRALSPLLPAKDAILVDTSHLTQEEVIEKIVELVREKKSYPKMKRSYRIVYTAARLFFRLFFRLQVFGISHFRQGAGLIVANHVSLYDPEVLSISCPEEVHFLAKESLFRIPLLGRLIRILNTHPIAKDTTDIQVIKQMVHLLREGKKLIVFPEGQRSWDGTLQPLERGIVFLAQKGDAPLFPAYIEGTFAAWPRGRRFPRPFGKIRVAFGSPISPQAFSHLPKKEAEEALLSAVRGSILSLKEWLEKGARGETP